MKEAKLSVGDVYVDVKPPRREWRIRRCREDSIMLERLDKPGVSRFLSPADLNDRHRYARKK